MILKNLYDGNWLNNETDVIMFEQTYFNGYINSFLMLRVSFEHVSGGAFHGQLRLKVNCIKSSGKPLYIFFSNLFTKLMRIRIYYFIATLYLEQTISSNYGF